MTHPKYGASCAYRYQSEHNPNRDPPYEHDRLANSPTHAEMHERAIELGKLGVQHIEHGRFAEAEACFLEALAIEPGYAEAHFKLGNIFYTRRQLPEAEACYRRAIAIAPDYVKAHYNLGNVLRDSSRLAEAETSYQRAVEIDPGYTPAHNNLGAMLMIQARHGEAETCFRSILEFQPLDVMAMNNLGLALKELGQFDEAAASYQNVLAISPDNADAYNNLGVVQRVQGRLAESDANYRRALELRPNFTNAHNNLLLGMNYTLCYSPADYLAEARRFGKSVSSLADKPYASWVCTPHPKCLKVGLVSGDLRNHVVGYFLESVLRQFDPARIELIAYPTYHIEDSLTARIRPCFSSWKPIHGLSDEDAANLIHADGIHLLIDLSGHTGHNRLPVFAWKPAPVQASWLGYFATTGVTEIDYILADQTGVPEDHQRYYTETVWYLPDTRMCFTEPRLKTPVSSLPALGNGFITFGCFQFLAKLNNKTLQVWNTILTRLPNAHIRFQHGQLNSSSKREELHRCLQEAGIPPDRVTMHGGLEYSKYLEAYAEVDFVLDTFPFPGGTTTCEALWMGVPTLTLSGSTMIQNQGASLLVAAGLPEWVADNEEDYIRKAVSFASDLPSLATLRRNLRQQVLASPLFDATRFARNLEEALWEMWAQRQRQTAESWLQNGVAHSESGRADEAEASYLEALALHPGFAEAHFKLGNIYNARRQFTKAEACYRRAIDIDPTYVKAHYNLGNALRDQSRPTEAEASFRRIMEIDPSYTAASNNLGAMLLDQKRYADSEACFRSVLRFQPNDAMALSNLGLALVAQEQFDEAEIAYRKALACNPNFPNVLNNMGILFHALGRHDEAEASYRQAIQIKPDYAEAFNNLGITLKAQGRLSDAEASHRTALSLWPGYIQAYNNLGVILKEQDRLDEAVASFKRALDIDPDDAGACNNLGIILADQGRAADAIALFRRAVKSDPDYTPAHTNLLFHLNYFGDSIRTGLLESERLFGQALTRKARTPFSSWLCENAPKCLRLRVGFVSGDFKNHPVAYFLEGVLAQLDPEKLELIAYANQQSDDDITARLRPRFSVWRTIAKLSDTAAARLIHADRLHLLIDLSGHTTGNRLPVFAWKPAPIQISWLGYFATTGVEQMDYVLATATEVPAEAKNQFTESIYYLPETRLCFNAPALDIPVEALPAKRNGFVTFGCFQNIAKITDEVLRVWAEILTSLPRAHLRFQHFQLAEPVVRDDFIRRMEALHFDPFRVTLFGGASREAYLATHNDIDIILDTFPYPGGTTTAEALWMGVPTLTLAGRTMTERQGASLLTAAGLPDWIANTQTEYVEKAIAFANDPVKLSALRSTLRQQVLMSPLFDAPRFARHFEQALWQIWLAHQSRANNEKST
jgi:predicted O-linked N-acetylglucosamine transferase (SPINDLY family)